MKAAFFNNTPEIIEKVYGMGTKERIKDLTNLYSEIVTEANFNEHAENMKDLDVIFSTWGMFALSDEQIKKMPNLKFIFYAASSVQSFAKAYMKHGVRIMSAWAANAVSVAEFALAQILLANKGFFSNILTSKDPSARTNYNSEYYRGNYEQTVALLGCGQVGKKLIELLKPFRLHILIYDPYVSENQAKMLGARKITLEEAFEKADVVSNHMPDLEATRQIITGAHFDSMRKGGTFINTGRGRTVAEDEMIAVLQKRPDLIAVLDVTWPEPPAEGSELYNLKNVFLTNHIAGSIGNEVVRMADYCIDEYLRFKKGEPLRYEVTEEMLKTMS